MYHSNRDPSIILNPRKTAGKHVDEFIREACMYYYGASSVTEEIYKHYVKFCEDKQYTDISTFNVFARAFRYYVIHMHYIPGVGVFPCNYSAYKDGVGYINKQGWSYSNLTVNY